MGKIENVGLIANQNETKFVKELAETIQEKQDIGYDVSVQYSNSINETVAFFSAIVVCRLKED